MKTGVQSVGRQDFPVDSTDPVGYSFELILRPVRLSDEMLGLLTRSYWMRLFRWCMILAVCAATSAVAQSPIFLDSLTESRLAYPQTYLFDFKGDGARAAGMGNAYMGVSDDISAGSWNPAGLYTAELVTLGFSLINFRPGGSGVGDIDAFDPSGADLSTYDISEAFTDNFPAFRVIAPLRIKGHPFVFSFGNNRTFEDFQKSEFNSSFDQLFVSTILVKTYYDTNRIDIAIDSKTHTKMNNVNIAFGTRLFQNLSGGFALNVFSGRSYRLENQLAFVHNFRLPTDIAFQFTDFQRDVTHYDTTRFSGYNVTVGFKYTAPRWTGALVIKSPLSLSAKLDSLKYRISSTVNQYGQIFPIEFGTDTVIAPRSLTKYDIPMSITFGGSFLLNENTLFSGDLEYRGWEGKAVKVRVDEELIPGSDSKETYLELDPHWQNVFSIRLGAERTFQTGIGKIPLRAGFGLIGLPTPESQIGIDSVSRFPVVSFASNRMTSASIGFGIHWAQIHLDWAVVRSGYSGIAYRSLGPDLSQDLETNIGYGNVETKNRSTSIFFSFTGVF
jgi:hypothetical protein